MVNWPAFKLTPCSSSADKVATRPEHGLVVWKPKRNLSKASPNIQDIYSNK